MVLVATNEAACLYTANKTLERDQAYCTAFSDVSGSEKMIFLLESWGLKSLAPHLRVVPEKYKPMGELIESP